MIIIYFFNLTCFNRMFPTTTNNKINPKKSRPILSILDSFHPFVWINGIAGLGMIEMPYGQPRPKLSIFYGFFRAIAFSTLAWYVVTNVPLDAHVSLITSIIYDITTAISVVAVVFSSVMGLINHEVTVQYSIKIKNKTQLIKQFTHNTSYITLSMLFQKSKEFFEKIKLADETLKMFGVKPKYSSSLRKNRKSVIEYCLAVIATFVILLGIPIYRASTVFTPITLRGLYFIVPLIVNPLVDINYIAKI